MFLARRERSVRHLRHSTLERRYDFHLSEAIRAALQGSHDKAAGHSGQALLISRELYAAATDPARHQPGLAAALCAHARYGGSTWQAIEMLTESAGHYAALAEAVGLKANLLVVPGHTFAIIKLPDGEMMPVENTGLGGGNQKLNEAIQAATA